MNVEDQLKGFKDPLSDLSVSFYPAFHIRALLFSRGGGVFGI